MSHLALTLLGSFQVHLNGQPVTDFRSNKVRALLAYLAVEADRPHQRARLAGLFWPEWPEVTALTYLRHAVHNLHTLLADRYTPSPFVHSTRNILQFNRQSDYWLDVEQFSQQRAVGVAREAKLLQPTGIDQWRQAVALYSGPLMPGFFLDGCAEFEEWLLLTRERLQRQCLTILQQLVDHYEVSQDYEQAQQVAWRRIELEPTLEEAHRQVMRYLALRGQRSAALAQYEQCRQMLAQELAVEPATETKLLYQQIRDGTLVAPVTPLQVVAGDKPSALLKHTPRSRVDNLPVPLTPLIGRQSELATIADHLHDPECRLLTLLGPGGIGKTRLALAAAGAARHDFAHGVVFVSLAGVNSTENIPGAIVDALKLHFYHVADFQQQLLDYLLEKTMLLVLDNYEHLLPDVTFLQTLLTAAPGIKVCATSRERLRLSAEWLLLLQGLTVPTIQNVASQTSTAVEQFSAISLFVKCARRIQPKFTLANENLVDVVQICRLVEGIPLGIELATGWLRVLPCAQIARSIAASLDFLTTSLQDVAERHRSMKGVFEHSWRFLTADEQNVLRRLAVFRDGFRPESAATVTGATLPLLLGLVDKSLLQADANGRFQMHELLRQFALTKLQETGATYQEAHDRYTGYYLHLLRQQFHFSARNISKEVYDNALAELSNIAAAWQWAIDQEYVEVVGEAIFSLWNYSGPRGFRGYHIELENAAVMLRKQLAQADITGDAALQLLVARYLTRVLVSLGVMANRLGYRALEESVVTECQNLLSRLADRASYEQAWAITLLAWYELTYGNKEKALTLGQVALNTFGEQIGFFERGYVHLLLGRAAYAVGNYEQAEAFFNINMAEWGTIVASGKTWALQALAAIARTQGDYEKGVQLTQECYQIQNSMNDVFGGTYSLCMLGHLRRSQKLYTEARTYYQRGLETAKEFGLQVAVETCQYGLGWIHYELADYEKAREYFESNLVLNQRLEQQSVTGIAATLNGLATVACVQGQYTEAQLHLQRALQIAKQSRSLPLTLDILSSWAQLFWQQGQIEEAQRLLLAVRDHPAGKHAVKEKSVHLLAKPEFAQPSSASSLPQQTKTVTELVETLLAQEPSA
ncbi:MAG: BTAD domain-containing putative transcriptional regulator [Caldilineaceae bacterium]